MFWPISSRFQSTLPGWGATPTHRIAGSVRPDFNPRSPDGERPCRSWGCVPRWHFNPRSPDGERLARPKSTLRHSKISIHAPRMGSDGRRRCCVRFMYIFQSTLPGWGATTSRTSSSTPSAGFQSTLPGWGATVVDLAGIVAMEFQSTLPGWGATMGASTGVSRDLFQSTLPGWGATLRIGQRGRPARISIHAPRMGSDHFKDGGHYFLVLFQSALPGWGATDARMDRATGRDFNPRSPDGERLSGG